MEALIWLGLFLVLLIIEIITLGLTTIWFAGGSLVAFLAALLGAGPIVQVVLFFIVSIALLFSTRPFAVKYFNKDRIKTNADSLIGKSAVVLEEVNNLKGLGRVVVNGQEWTARTQEDTVCVDKDKKVKILKITGVKLIVEEESEE